MKTFTPSFLRRTGGPGFQQVGTADIKALVDQHLGNTIHTGTADTDEVHPPDTPHRPQMTAEHDLARCCHDATHSRQAATTFSAASGSALPLAAIAMDNNTRAIG